MAPRSSDRPPSGPQEASKGSQEGPKTAQEAPQTPKEGPKSRPAPEPKVSTPGLPCFNVRLPWIALSGSPPRLPCAKHAEVGIALCDSTLY